MIIAIAALSGCSREELTEREQTIRFAKKTADERLLKLVEQVDEILDAPVPTEDEIDKLVNNAISNMVRIEDGEFIMGYGGQS